MDTYTVQTAAQLSQHLKAFRRVRGLTQAELAKRLGLGQARYATIENHPETISTAQLLDVLAALEVDVLLRAREKSKSARAPRPKREDW